MRGLVVDLHFASHPQLTAAGPLGMLFYLAAAAYAAIHRTNFVPMLIAEMLIPRDDVLTGRALIDRCLAAGVLRLTRRRGRQGLEVVDVGLVHPHVHGAGSSTDRVRRWRQRQKIPEEAGDFHISTGIHRNALRNALRNVSPELQDPEKSRTYEVQVPGEPAQHTHLTDQDWRRLCAVARREIGAHPELGDWTSRLDHVKTVCLRARLPGANTPAISRALECVLSGRR